MPLEACMPEIVSRFNSLYRRPRHGGDTTLAAHWDGTYRDRVWVSEDEFWGDFRSDDYSEIILPARRIAEHLAVADA